MGQYFYVVNLDKRQYLHPHVFGDGLKLMEFGSSGQATLLGLTVLMADSNGQGGGDFDYRDQAASPGLAELIGSWAGDRIVFTGDYSEATYKTRDGLPINPTDSLYATAAEHFQNISSMVVELLLQGGEGVRFDPRSMANHDGAENHEGRWIEDETRAQRCIALVHELPAWAQDGHPVLTDRHLP